MTPYEIVTRLKATKTGSGWSARCPAHDDKNPSLSITSGNDGRVLLHCHAGCRVGDICKAIQLTPADLFPPKENRCSRIVASYPYQDANGKLSFEVVRYDPKNFKQRRPDPTAKDGWIWNLNGVQRVLYRLPEVLAAVKNGQTIYLAEGEKDVDALVKNGFCATCNSGGAGKCLDVYSETLRGVDAIIIPDRDKPGREHAQLVAGKLDGIAAKIRVLELPDVGGKSVKDAHDYFSAGGSRENLLALAETAPDWKPEPATPILQPSQISSAADIRGVIIEILRNDEILPAAKRTCIATKVVEALTQRGKFFFHAERRDFDTAMFFDNERKRLERIRSDAFISWLSEWVKVNRADTLFRYIHAEAETAALSGQHTTGILPESYWAAKNGVIYISNGDGSAVKVTPQGVETVSNGADGILFSAGKTLPEWKLTTPADPFKTCRIFCNPHCRAEHGQDLLRIFLYSMPTNPASKPPLCLVGDVGAGKTRLMKAIAELFGFPFRATKVENEAEANFWPALEQGGLYVLDNADTKCHWLADAIANAATDGCTQRRRLYTNSETVIFRPKAWLAVTTANPSFARDAGLADRLLVVRMERREEETSDATLTEEILKVRDAGLSHIAWTLQTALADNGPIPPGLNARHPDFAAFAVRIGRALGREDPTISALLAAEQDKSAFCLENDNIASALLAYLDNANSFIGSAAELLPRLIETDRELDGTLSAKRLGKRLAALWPHLQKVIIAKRDMARRVPTYNFRKV